MIPSDDVRIRLVRAAINVEGSSLIPAIPVTASVEPSGVLVTPTFAATIVAAMNAH